MKSRYYIGGRISNPYYWFRSQEPMTKIITDCTYVEKYTYCGEPRIEASYYRKDPLNQDSAIIYELRVRKKVDEYIPQETINMDSIGPYIEPSETLTHVL